MEGVANNEVRNDVTDCQRITCRYPQITVVHKFPLHDIEYVYMIPACICIT